MAEPKIAEYLMSQVGEGRRHKSPRQLSLAAGLSENVVGIVVDRNRADPETLMKLAAALDVPATYLFMLQGWVSEEELEGKGLTPLDTEEAALVNRYRELPEDRRAVLRAVLEGFLEPANQSA